MIEGNIIVRAMSIVLCTLVIWYDVKTTLKPRTAYSLIWGMCHLLLLFDGLGLFSDQLYAMSVKAEFLIFVSHVGVMLGAWYGGSVGRLCSSRKNEDESKVRSVGWFVAVAAVELVVIAMLSVDLHGTVNAFAVAIAEGIDRQAILAKSADGQANVNSSSLAGVSAMGLKLLVCLALCLYRHGIHVRTCAVILGFLTVYFAFVTGAKAGVIAVVMAIIAVYLVDRGRDARPRIRGELLAGLMMTCLVFGSWAINFLFTTTSRDLSQRSSVGEMARLYMTAGQVAFSEYISVAPSQMSVTSHTLPLFGRWMYRLGVTSSFTQSNYKEYIETPYWINTYTWLFEFYQDLGVLGVLVYPFLISFGVQVAFVNVRTSLSLWRLLLYVYLFDILCRSFFSLQHIGTMFIVGVLVAKVLEDAIVVWARVRLT